MASEDERFLSKQVLTYVLSISSVLLLVIRFVSWGDSIYAQIARHEATTSSCRNVRPAPVITNQLRTRSQINTPPQWMDVTHTYFVEPLLLNSTWSEVLSLITYPRNRGTSHFHHKNISTIHIPLTSLQFDLLNKTLALV